LIVVAVERPRGKYRRWVSHVVDFEGGTLESPECLDLDVIEAAFRYYPF
jgi:hypothetical protein